MKKLILLYMVMQLLACDSKKSETIINAPTKKTEQSKMNSLSSAQKTDIKNALEALLKRENADAFVIITEGNSDKFIQFTVNNGNLLVDLPTSQLSEEQLNKAKITLKSYGINYEIQKAYDSENSNVITGEFGTFSKEINDVNVGVEIVEKVFSQVFNPTSEIAIKIEEN